MFGVNVLTQFLQDRNDVLAWLEQLKPAAVVVMDDMGYAVEVKRRLPNCIVIHRSYHPDDAEFHLKWTLNQFADAYLTNVPAGIVVQVLNEPTGYANLPTLARWCESVMALAASRGIPLALPHFGKGHPKENFADELDDLWRSFGRYPQHILAVHEYFEDQPAFEQPFHIRRFDAIAKRFQQLGIPLPRIVITEAGRDIGGGLHDGWRSIYNETVYATKLAQQANAYKGTAVVGVCVFCAGKGGGNRWQAFDIETAGTVKQSMVEYNRRNTPVTQFPKPDLSPLHEALVTSAGAQGSNVREAPTTAAKVVGSLKKGDTISISEKFVRDGGYDWRQVRKGDVSGYAAFGAGAVLEVEAVPKPQEPPNSPPSFPDNITEADNLRLIFKGLEVGGDQMITAGQTIREFALKGVQWLDGWMDRNGDPD